MPNEIVSMTRTMVHRGPDDEGYHFDRNLGLGFRRLSIIDLSGGHQPMADAQESVWVIFNGEIYNFKEVRRELESAGYEFRTNSDTEVIIHGYKRWGKDVLKRLNGMFGLAIWDAVNRRLIIARDRMGIKVVYYKVDRNRLLFGSEIRPILAALDEKPAIDAEAIRLFLRYRYTPSPNTIFEGINKLAPGTCLIAEEGRTPIVERWWDFAPTPFEPMPNDRDAEERLLDLYAAAVKRHLISDVPVGLLLSAGVDSALLLGLMSREGRDWNTYTVGYGQSFADDELKDAAETARIFQARHNSVQISRATFEASLAEIAAILEEPVATSSVIPMYFVCQRARQDVTVALMGQGPDELFGGYKRHLGVNYGSYWRELPGPVRSVMGNALGRMSRSESIQRALYSLNVSNRLSRYQQVFSILSPESVNELFHSDMFAGDGIPQAWSDLEPLMRGTDELGGLQFLEVRSSLPDELLVYADKLSMAHSLELRVPYLDQEVVEYAERLSASFKVRNGRQKWLHRRVAERFLPAEIIRRKKMGFASNVVDDWFSNSLSGTMDGALADRDALIYQYLRRSKVEQLLVEHKAKQTDHHKILFSLVVLENLLRKYEFATQPEPVAEFANQSGRA